MDIIEKWKKDMLMLIEFGEDNLHPDHPVCPKCGWPMEFHNRDRAGEVPFGEGYWICPSCDFKVYEYELYN